MDRHVKYRPFESRDARDLAGVISDTWKFDSGAAGLRWSAHINYAYLYVCMLEADYTQVAEIDGHAVGIIIGRICGKGFRPLIALKLLYHSAVLLISGIYRKVGHLFNGYAEKSDILDEMSGVTKGDFDAEAALFIVSKEFRGYGVGSFLFGSLERFFCEKGVRHYYLHTDTACNYAFYEHKGLKRRAEIHTEISYAGVDDITMFVYGK